MPQVFDDGFLENRPVGGGIARWYGLYECSTLARKLHKERLTL